MKKYLLLFMLIARISLAGELDVLTIGVPDAVFQARPNAVERLTMALWTNTIAQLTSTNDLPFVATPEIDISKINTWKKCRIKTDHTKIWWLYDVTKKQIKDNLSPARRQQLKDILPDAGVRWDDLPIVLVKEKYGLEEISDGF